ncbi:hypothetical protein CEXT_166971 [Caerostris extrusa]|uniref:Uncharacterized protein n=1 Tax=Caerostris extrusa TaxID=172846 RepID=A0AAV4VAV1_CAEEX|nr:hypothetical protein CEXT_166971 [Caerostris extrusa]
MVSAENRNWNRNSLLSTFVTFTFPGENLEPRERSSIFIEHLSRWCESEIFSFPAMSAAHERLLLWLLRYLRHAGESQGHI